MQPCYHTAYLTQRDRDPNDKNISWIHATRSPLPIGNDHTQTKYCLKVAATLGVPFGAGTTTTQT